MNRWVVPVLIVLAAACSSEASRVREARNEFYAASARFDAPALKASVTPDWLAVDRDRIISVDSLVADFETLRMESLQVRYTFADSTVRVDPPLAWMVYRGRKIIRRPNAADTTFSIESAAFRRDGGGWRLTLLHRTPILAAGNYFDSGAPPAPSAPPAESTTKIARPARPATRSTAPAAPAATPR